jgi:serine/threonine protein kinase
VSIYTRFEGQDVPSPAAGRRRRFNGGVGPGTGDDRAITGPDAVQLPRGLEPIRTLGVGGFGRVVHARDPNLGRDVAVKLVYGGGHVTDSVARMLREGQALARLRHPSVIHVYEAVRLGADVALLMEYVEGGDLTGRLNQSGFGVTDRLAVLDQVASGLAEAHRVGIVHRDLKPANILVADGPHGPLAKIADFGLARLSREAAAFRTEAGVAAFTPGYGAPEQMVDPDHESPQIDWYSFAVVAFRLLRGTLPLPGARAGAGEELFDRGLALDPAERIRPDLLVAGLRQLPADGWTPVVGRGFGDAPPARDDATDAVDGDVRPSPVTVRVAVAAEGADAPPVRDDGPWLEMPVYHPPPVALGRRRGVRLLAVLLAGCLLGALLAAGVLLLR